MTATRPAHILVAIDGSHESFDACRQAVALAHACRARLTALHVAVALPPRNPMSRVEYRQVEAAARLQGARLLPEACALGGGLVPCATELHQGKPVDVICDRSKELDVDLIVVGSRGLNALDRFLLGSTSTTVAQRAHCTVLIARPRAPGAA